MTQREFNLVLQASYYRDVEGFGNRQEYVVVIASILAKVYGLRVT